MSKEDIQEAYEKGFALHKYADPISDAERDITIEFALEVADEDPGLIYWDGSES